MFRNLIPRLPLGQDWFISRMKSLKYRASEGVCFGLAHMGMHAFLDNDLASFEEQLDEIYAIPLSNFAKVIEDAKKEKVAIFAKAKLEALEELKKRAALDEKTIEVLEEIIKHKELQKATLYKNILNQKIEDALNKQGNTAKFSLRKLLNIPAFFEGVELFHQNYLYPHLFEKDKKPLPATQVAKPALDLMRLERSEDFKHLVNKNFPQLIHSFSDNYDLDKLNIYFKTLRTSIEKQDIRFSFILRSTAHAIHVGFDPKEKRWVLIDANKLPAKYFQDDDKISQAVLKALSTNGVTHFATQTYVTINNEKKAKNCLKTWHENPQFQAIHSINEKSLLQDSLGDTLAHNAALRGDSEKIDKLIENARGLYFTTDKPNHELLNVNKIYLYSKKDTDELAYTVKKATGEIIERIITNEEKNILGEHYQALKKQFLENPLPNEVLTLNKALDHTTKQALELFFKMTSEKGDTFDVDLDIPSSKGVTPLLLAAQNGHLEIVIKLIHLGANVNQVDQLGATPLSMAAENGHLEVVKALIEANADCVKEMKDGTSPLYMSAQNGHLEVVKALIEAKADCNKAEMDGLTPIYIAAEKGHLEVVKALIDAKAECDKATSKDFTPLYVAAQNGHLEIVRALIQQGVDVNRARNNGVTPLFIAVKKGHLEVARTLIQHGGHVNQALTDGSTVLFIAAQNGHLEVVEHLLHAGANPNLAFRTDINKLRSFADENNKLESFKNLFVRDKNGSSEILMTPLDIARRMGHSKVAEKLSPPEELYKTKLFCLLEKIQNYPFTLNSGGTMLSGKKYPQSLVNIINSIEPLIIKKDSIVTEELYQKIMESIKNTLHDKIKVTEKTTLFGHAFQLPGDRDESTVKLYKEILDIAHADNPLDMQPSSLTSPAPISLKSP